VELLLGTAYFPPVEYFAAAAYGMTLSRDKVIPSIIYIESSENYQKQSYRNRCSFYAENGVQNLNFPIVHKGGAKIPICEVEVDWSKDWLLQQKRAIISAYKTSAFFDYYQDELFAIMDSHPKTLFELNLAIFKFFADKIGLKVEIRFTDDYHLPIGEVSEGVWKGLPKCKINGKEVVDLREVIHPKRENDILDRLGLKGEYFQVFGMRYGFKPHLSVMDLLFNMGPEAIIYLKTLNG
jgi:hypothetical protein